MYLDETSRPGFSEVSSPKSLQEIHKALLSSLKCKYRINFSLSG